MRPRAIRLFPKEYALKIILHDGYLPTENDVRKDLLVVFVPSLVVDLRLKVRWSACGSAVVLQHCNCDEALSLIHI
eukprot:3402529-Pyramimonas_sp.AAC.1